MHIAGRHGSRTAPVALARCRAPRLNRFVLNTKFVVRGTPQAHDAASPARRSKYRTPQGGDGAHVGRAAVAKLRVFRTRGLDAVGEAPRCGELCPEKTTERPRLSWVVYSRGSEQRVHSHGDGRGEGDARRRGLARRRARRRRAQTSYRSGCPIALPCPETQPIVLSTKIVVRGAPQAHEAASRARRSK